MTDKRMFFYYLQPHWPAGVGVSASMHPQIFFSTQRKLEKWKEKHPDQKDAQWGMGEISLFVAKELIKLSKKKPKEKCPECGK